MIAWLAAAAWGHPAGHGEVRHDLALHVTPDEAVLTASITLPEGLLGHDPALDGNSWWTAGLELHDGTRSAPVAVEGTGRSRRAVARLPLEPSATTLTVGDASLPGERHLWRWALTARGRTVEADALVVFDGHRRRSIEDRWVRQTPRELVVEVGAAAPRSWTVAWLGALGLALAAGAGAYSSRRRAKASAS